MGSYEQHPAQQGHVFSSSCSTGPVPAGGRQFELTVFSLKAMETSLSVVLSLGQDIFG